MPTTTIYDCLRGLSMYPVPEAFLDGLAEMRGISLTDTATQQALASAAYNLAVADVLQYLADAPDISQGGQSYSFNDEQRTQFRSRARMLRQQYMTAEEKAETTAVYGYKGSRL